MLQGKKILLGITGGIAAYKCAHLVRLLIKEGAEVKVVMTPSAIQFVTPQTLSVLSKNQVYSDFFDKNHNWQNHVALAEWADLFLIAPLTANTLAGMASGLCNNLLLACYLSAKSKTMVAPAMDLDMYQHPSVKNNLHQIAEFGNLIIPAEKGELASGLVGQGRMAEPEHIVTFIKRHFNQSLPLQGKRAVVNAGPTFEAIDPVRYIGNRSSGKMGLAVALELTRLGAEVTLVLGPSSENIPTAIFNVIRVESSVEMFEATLKASEEADIVICSAAVADYKPSKPSSSKIKKSNAVLNIELEKTKDILAALGQNKKYLLVGFALETEDLINNATDKLKRKNADMIVANHANAEGSSVFGNDYNKITILNKHNKITNFELKTKQETAAEIVKEVIAMLSEKTI